MPRDPIMIPIANHLTATNLLRLAINKQTTVLYYPFRTSLSCLLHSFPLPLEKNYAVPADSISVSLLAAWGRLFEHNIT